jgi:hypothetical protein
MDWPNGGCVKQWAYLGCSWYLFVFISPCLGWRWFECFSFIHQIGCEHLLLYNFAPPGCLTTENRFDCHIFDDWNFLVAVTLKTNFFLSCRNFSDEIFLVIEDSTINTHLICNDRNRFWFVQSMVDWLLPLMLQFFQNFFIVTLVVIKTF